LRKDIATGAGKRLLIDEQEKDYRLKMDKEMNVHSIRLVGQADGSYGTCKDKSACNVF